MRFIAEKFIERVLHNQPYLAVHWRYESDWLDMCKPERPKGARMRNGAICRLVTGLDSDQTTRDLFINNIKAKMTAYGLQSVYLASPPNVSKPLTTSVAVEQKKVSKDSYLIANINFHF